MLNELKFVQGAVAKKDFIPALKHFRIEDGTIRSFNGSMALCSPIDLDIACSPKAEPFIKAIQSCKDTVSLSLTPNGRLSVKSGSFRAFIDCIEEEVPHVLPDGEKFDIDGELLLKGLKRVAPFIGDDASRPWSNGVLLKGQSLFATNNISVIEYWLGVDFPFVCNIPRDAIKEMLRIGEAPIAAQMTDKNVTLHYEDGKWIRTTLLETAWPDMGKILNVASSPVPIPEQLYEGLATIKPFTDKMGRIYLHEGTLRTSLIEGEGATYKMDDFNYEGAYQIKFLELLQGTADSMDFTLYPKPCLFFGERLRGALIGLKV